MWDFATCWLEVFFLLNLFSDPENGGDMFLRNVGLKLYGRGAQAVHSAQCAMMCTAVSCTRARDGTARPGR
jgi:hypothetical protein